MNPLAEPAPGIKTRPIRDSDAPFLFEVYSSTRDFEMDYAGMAGEERARFLRMQFDAQNRDYFANYPSASYLVVLLDERPVGRLYVDRRQDEIRVLDIALLPDYQNSGIGRSIFVVLLKEAEVLGIPVRLHVLQYNLDALRLYDRLGFRLLRNVPPYYLIQWSHTKEGLRIP